MRKLGFSENDAKFKKGNAKIHFLMMLCKKVLSGHISRLNNAEDSMIQPMCNWSLR